MRPIDLTVRLIPAGHALAQELDILPVGVLPSVPVPLPGPDATPSPVVPRNAYRQKIDVAVSDCVRMWSLQLAYLVVVPGFCYVCSSWCLISSPRSAALSRPAHYRRLRLWGQLRTTAVHVLRRRSRPTLVDGFHTGLRLRMVSPSLTHPFPTLPAPGERKLFNDGNLYWLLARVMVDAWWGWRWRSGNKI